MLRLTWGGERVGLFGFLEKGGKQKKKKKKKGWLDQEGSQCYSPQHRRETERGRVRLESTLLKGGGPFFHHKVKKGGGID